MTYLPDGCGGDSDGRGLQRGTVGGGAACVKITAKGRRDAAYVFRNKQQIKRQSDASAQAHDQQQHHDHGLL